MSRLFSKQGPISQRFTRGALYMFCALAFTVVAGCGGGIKSNGPEQDDTKVSLLSTLEAIPVQKLDDETSLPLPYEARENPYLLLKGRVKKESVASYIQARRLVAAKKWGQAERVLAALTESDTKLSGPWVMRGNVAAEQQEYEAAEDFYRQALVINDKNVNAYIGLAYSQRLQGKFLPAQNTYAQALALWPDFPEAHLNLGILYDVYLNMPLRAQKHIEAYQFLTRAENKKVAKWLAEIQGRTGVSATLLPPAKQTNTAVKAPSGG